MDSVPPVKKDSMNIEDVRVPQDVVLTSTIKVEKRGEADAVVTIPKELRLTPELMELINQAVAAQGLSLVHMNITSKHVDELKDLPNVVLNKGTQI